MLVDISKSGFPLKPPDSPANGWLLTGSGLEIVVFDTICREIAHDFASQVSCYNY